MTGILHKHAIVKALGEQPLLLPDQIAEAVAANARLKYYLSLLQMAQLHADAPDMPANDLHLERAQCAIEDVSLDHVIANARITSDGDYRIPGSRAIAAHIDDDVARMLDPLRAASTDVAAVGALQRRASALSAVQALGSRETFDADKLAEIIPVRDGHDSLHRLVMDVHKALNALERSLSTESIAGGQTYGITDEDRPLVATFMEGVERTARLKFDHPGLSTTATRSGSRLVIENDVGETEAHVVVIHVEGLRAAVTMTDGHLQRLNFFRSLFEGFAVEWQDPGTRREPSLGPEQLFYLAVGTFDAASATDLERFLNHLGSRLVFLIDWNRARKQLRNFLPNEDCVALLKGAADEACGHRGLLEMGGADLIYGAMTAVMRTPFRFGERLDEILGREPTMAFLRFALREAAEGLLQGRSRSLIRERIFGELAERAPTATERLLGLAADHALIVVELARLLASRIADIGGEGAVDALASAAQVAKSREHDADDLVQQMRSLVDRIPTCAPLGRLVEIADDAADLAEEGLFQLTLLPRAPIPESMCKRLGALGAMVAGAADAYGRSLETARDVRRGAPRETLHDFLSAIDSVVVVEHDADAAQRQILAEMMAQTDLDARAVLVLGEVTRRLEEAADSLMHATLALRDEVMGDVMTRGR